MNLTLPEKGITHPFLERGAVIYPNHEAWCGSIRTTSAYFHKLILLALPTSDPTFIIFIPPPDDDDLFDEFNAVDISDIDNLEEDEKDEADMGDIY